MLCPRWAWQISLNLDGGEIGGWGFFSPKTVSSKQFLERWEENQDVHKYVQKTNLFRCLVGTWPVLIYLQPSDETLGVPRAPEFCLIPCFCYCATHYLPKGHKPSGPCVHLLGQCVLPMSNACCCIQHDDELFMAAPISLFCARASRGSVSACTSAVTCLPLELRAQFGAWNRLCRLQMAYRGGNESGSLGITLVFFSPLPRDSLSLTRMLHGKQTNKKYSLFGYGIILFNKELSLYFPHARARKHTYTIHDI